MNEATDQPGKQSQSTAWENMPQNFNPDEARRLKDAQAFSNTETRPATPEEDFAELSKLFQPNPAAEVIFRQNLKSDDIDLLGGNTEQKSVHFELLTDRFANEPDKIKKYCNLVQNIYLNAFEQAEHSTVTPLPVGDDGKVIVNVGQPYHKCSADLRVLSSITQHGVTASEWFGVAESEGEGRLCAFTDEVIDDNDPTVQSSVMLRTKNLKGFNGFNTVSLLFDRNNPVFQQLKSLDYFQYKKDLANNSTDVEKKYPPEIRDLYDNFILPLSPGLPTDVLANPKMPYYYWSAIPGGIPPQLVNGVCVYRNNSGVYPRHVTSDEKIQKIAQLFPNATIFDEDRNALHTPIPETQKFFDFRD